MNEATLNCINFEGAKLANLISRGYFITGKSRDTDLSLANFTEADLNSADLSNANLSLTNLTDAKLYNSKLTKEQLDSAILCRTELPEEFTVDLD